MLTQDFADVITCLNRHKASYLLVGAFAMAHFGYRRATGDIDLWVEPSPGNSTRVISALKEFGAPMGVHGIDAGYFALQGNFYQIGLPPNRIDIITEISGVSYSEAKESAEVAQLAGVDVPLLSLALLIRNKNASGRPKDLADAAELQKILGQSGKQ
jgi:hypothetical protein